MRYGYATWLGRVLELDVTATLRDLNPSILLERSYHEPAIHVSIHTHAHNRAQTRPPVWAAIIAARAHGDIA